MGRFGNADNEDSRDEIKALPEWMWSPTVGYVVYEYGAVVVLILDKKIRCRICRLLPWKYIIHYRLIFWMDCGIGAISWNRVFYRLIMFLRANHMPHTSLASGPEMRRLLYLYVEVWIKHRQSVFGLLAVEKVESSSSLRNPSSIDRFISWMD